MKYLFIIVLLLIGYCSNAQVYQEMPQYGYRANRMSFDSTLQIPTTCGVPTLKSVVNVSKKAAIAFDTCNKRFYYYNPKLQQWDTIKSGTTIDTTSLSNRINLKLNIADTANKWINSLYRKAGKDSIFYKIGSTEYSIKDSTGGVQNGRFGNDTATIVMAKVHNDAGSPLTNGEVVFFSKSGTSSDAPSVKRAYNKADSTSANTFGFVKGTIATNDTGYVILYGKIEKLNTSAFSNGDIIYLDSIAGKFTKTKPHAPYHLVYLGVVVKANAGNGAIYVRVQNGFEIEELHDVQINSALNNQVIVYSDTQKLWKNRNIYSIVDTNSLSNRINNIDLQSVTNNGDTTNHSLYIQSLKLYDGVNNGYGSIDNTDGIYTFKDYNGNNRLSFEEGLLSLYSSTNPITINSISTTASRTYYLPDTSGVFAMRSDSTLFQTKFRTDTMRNNIYSALNGKQSTLTFSTGLTNTAGTITSNLSTGVSGGQSIIGGTAASNALTLSSTSNATKGKLLFGTSAYDEANNRLGIGTASPSNTLQVEYLPTANTQNVAVFKNNSTTLANSYTCIALDCANTAADQVADIRLGSTNPKGLRIYASNVDLTGSPAGAGFQFYSTSSTNFPGQIYFDGGAHNSSSIIFRTAQTSGSITQRMRIFAGGNIQIGSTAVDGGFKLDVNGTGRYQNTLTTAGNLVAYVAKTGAYTAAATDEIIACDATSAAFTITLPTAASKTGQRYTIKKTDSSANAVTIGTTSSQTIDGSTTYSLASQWKYATIISNGSNWLIISNN